MKKQLEKMGVVSNFTKKSLTLKVKAIIAYIL